MKKRIQKKSEVLQEGYIKGLKKAQSIILAEMAGAGRKYAVSDVFRTGELFNFCDFQIDNLISIQEDAESIIDYSQQMLDHWHGVNIRKNTEDEVREAMDAVMEGYVEVAKLLSHIKYKFVDSGLCETVANWASEHGEHNATIQDILSPVRGKER